MTQESDTQTEQVRGVKNNTPVQWIDVHTEAFT